MPSLRFVLDKRGYENTFVVQGRGQRTKGTRQRILYWFRTPPGVKVGRVALDEDAIKAIEEGHPGETFDWERMLKVRTSAPRRREPPVRRPRSGVRRRASSADQPLAPGAAEGAGPSDAAEKIAGPSDDGSSQTEIPAVGAPVAAFMDAENLTKLRTRYSELLARIDQRVQDLERREALRQEAEAVNPDSWVTAAETAQGLAELDGRYAALRTKLGARRRRSRRGGRRRRPRGERTTAAPAPGPDGSSD